MLCLGCRTDPILHFDSQRKWIQGTCLTLEDLLNPVEEREVGNSPYRYPGGDAEIVADVRQEQEGLGDKGESGNVSSEDEDTEELLTPQNGIDLCTSLEKLSLQYADTEGFDLWVMQCQLQKLHSHLWRLDLQSRTQLTLDWFFATANGTPTALVM